MVSYTLTLHVVKRCGGDSHHSLHPHIPLPQSTPHVPTHDTHRNTETHTKNLREGQAKPSRKTWLRSLVSTSSHPQPGESRRLGTWKRCDVCSIAHPPSLPPRSEYNFRRHSSFPLASRFHNLPECHHRMVGEGRYDARECPATEVTSSKTSRQRPDMVTHDYHFGSLPKVVVCGGY
jgi:hypothetical protein